MEVKFLRKCLLLQRPFKSLRKLYRDQEWNRKRENLRKKKKKSVENSQIEKNPIISETSRELL